MPKIYEYFGLIFFFHTNDHFEPSKIHIHVKYTNYENKYELTFKGGEVVNVTKKRVKGKQELPPQKARLAEELIDAKKDAILRKWMSVFVTNEKVQFIKITRKL